MSRIVVAIVIMVLVSGCSVRMFNHGTETKSRVVQVEGESTLIDLGVPLP